MSLEFTYPHRILLPNILGRAFARDSTVDGTTRQRGAAGIVSVEDPCSDFSGGVERRDGLPTAVEYLTFCICPKAAKSKRESAGNFVSAKRGFVDPPSEVCLRRS